MPPIYIKPKEFVCEERAKKDAIYHYQPYINSLEKNLEKTNSTKIRIELNRVKSWVKDYEDWAKLWHMSNYIRSFDIYNNPDHAAPDELNNPPKAPVVDVFFEFK